MKRRFQSVIVRGDETYTMPFRTDDMAWHFIAGRAEAAGEPGSVCVEIMHFTHCGGVGTVLGERGVYSVEAL